MTSEPHTPKHPSHASGGIALLAAFCATGLNTSGSLQLTIVVIEAIGGFIVLGSSVIRHRGKRAGGLVLLLSGSLLISIAFGLSAVFPVGLIERGALIGGMGGSVLIILAIYPLRTTWSRAFTGLGTTVLISGVLVRGWLGAISSIHLFGAVMMTILAWDAAEQAITLGKDVGRSTRTFVVSLTHTSGSLAIGIVAIISIMGLSTITPSTIPLVAVALLLGLIPILLLSLYLPYLR